MNLLHAIPPLITASLVLLPAPAGLATHAWHYAVLFATAVVTMVATPLPGGAIGLVAVSLVAAWGGPQAQPDPGAAIRWALGGFADPAVWLTFGAFVFAIGYRASGLGRRIALNAVRLLGRRPLGLGYAIALADLLLAPGMPSNTARSGGVIHPIVREMPPLFAAQRGVDVQRLGAFLMWTAFAATAVTSSMFLTALVPNVAALALAQRLTGLQLSWWEHAAGFAPTGVLLLAIVPPLSWLLCRPNLRDGTPAVAWASEQLRAMGPVSRREATMAALIGFALLLWIAGANPQLAAWAPTLAGLHPTTVVLLAVSLMLITRVVDWQMLLAEREAWAMLIYFTMMLTLAEGLNRCGFIEWLARRFSASLAGVEPKLALLALLALFFWLHYLFASITAHAVAVLPVVLALAAELPGMPVQTLALLCLYSLGLMGVLCPHATSCAPIYAACGYLSRGRFWMQGLVFGALYFAALWLLTLPWVLATLGLPPP